MPNNQKVKCAVCGQPYDVCRFCPSTTAFTPWRTVCCSQEHYKILITVSDYEANALSKEQAKQYLSHLELTTKQIDGLLPETAKLVKEILK